MNNCKKMLNSYSLALFRNSFGRMRNVFNIKEIER